MAWLVAQLCLSLTLTLGKSHFASLHLRLSASVKWLVNTWPRFLGGIVSCPSPADGRCESSSSPVGKDSQHRIVPSFTCEGPCWSSPQRRGPREGSEVGVAAPGVRSHGVQLRTPARPTSLARPWSVAGTLTGGCPPLWPRRILVITYFFSLRICAHTRSIIKVRLREHAQSEIHVPGPETA